MDSCELVAEREPKTGAKVVQIFELCKFFDKFFLKKIYKVFQNF